MGRPVVLALLAVGCGFDVTSADLDGVWTNDDDGASRTIQFDAQTLAYAFDVDDVEVQTGTYVVSEDVLVNVDGEEVTEDHVLVWTIGYDLQGTAPGTTFGDPIYRFTGDEMDLRSGSAASGQRTWIRVE